MVKTRNDSNIDQEMNCTHLLFDNFLRKYKIAPLTEDFN